jgi:hypothetical protein
MIEAGLVGKKITDMSTKDGLNPLKSAVPVFLQLPIFMSMFFGLRGEWWRGLGDVRPQGWPTTR